MKKEKTPKIPDNFRVRVGSAYCSLSHDFHELGCLIPNATLETAHVFRNLNGCNHAVERTTATQDLVRRSMIPNFKAFKPLLFSGEMEVERFPQKSP